MSPGKAAYDNDVRGCPLHNDGTPRKAWCALSEVVRDSWERNPTPRRIYPTIGTYFHLPLGMSCLGMFEIRKLWNVPAELAPLAVAPGVIAWGVPMPCNYERLAS